MRQRGVGRSCLGLGLVQWVGEGAMAEIAKVDMVLGREDTEPISGTRL